MSLSDNYRQLAALIEALESQGATVQQAIPVVEPHGTSPNDSFVVRLEVGLPEDSVIETLTPALDAPSTDRTDDTTAESVDSSDCTSDTTSDDKQNAAAETADDTHAPPGATDPPPGDTHAQSVETTGETGASDASASDESAQPVVCTKADCDRTFETERGMKIHRTKAHCLPDAPDRTGDGPRHANPEVLKEVYREHETFAEMTAALDVDVGAQAVRKQMIRHGIHQPEGSVSETASDGDDGDDDHEVATTAAEDTDSAADSDEAELSDESKDPVDPDDTESADDTDDTTSDRVDGTLPPLDLPEDLTAAELKTAVEEANTLYDVQRTLELDRPTTQEILETYDLLDLVTGRASTARARKEQKDELYERLRRTAT